MNIIKNVIGRINQLLKTQKGSRFCGFCNKHKTKLIIISLVILVIGSGMIRNRSAAEDVKSTFKQVEVVTVEDLKGNGGEIPLIGTLKANEQLDLRPQMPGQISAVRVEINQEVQTGQILIEVAHRDLDAAVGQASATLQSAYAGLEKMKNGARPEDIVIARENLFAAQQQLEDMKNGGRPEEIAQVRNTVDLALKSLDDANTNLVRVQQQTVNASKSVLENAKQVMIGAQIAEDKALEEDLDDVFNANDYDQLIPLIKDASLESQANQMRGRVEASLTQWENSVAVLDVTNKDAVLTALADAEIKLNEFVTFLSVTGNALQQAHPSDAYNEAQISMAKMSVNTVRSIIKGQLDGVISIRQAVENQDVLNDKAIEGARSQINAAKANYDNAQEQLQITRQGPTSQQISIQEARVSQAEQQLMIAEKGARPEDLKLQQASVAQAQASVGMAVANRDKAIIRAPIAGTVTYLPYKIGELISSSTIVVSIANKSGLEVETYVTEKERIFIDVGNEVTINETIKGIVRDIAPALDPIHKKIKVNVTVTDENPEVTLGETVRIVIHKTSPERSVIKLPLSAVRLKSDSAEVFVLGQNNKLESLPVVVGEVTGNYIEVFTELEPDLQIVSDARGLKVGQEVGVRS